MRAKRLAKSPGAIMVLLSLAMCKSTCGSGDRKQAAPAPIFSGRFATDPEHPEAKLFAWSQSSISARFLGTSVAVRLQDAQRPPGDTEGPNYFKVQIDDRPAFVLPMREQQTVYKLADDLPQGRHTVTLTKRTEASVGTARFFGFDFGPEGHMLVAPKRSERRLLVIGDSISAGYGNEGKDQNCPFTPATENSDLAYGSVAARALGADIHVIAWSGKGVSQNRDGTKQDLMPELQDRILPTDANSRWNPADYVPRAVVVNLGTNDFAHDVAPRQPFQDAYYNLIIKLRSYYPEAYIVMALGPMMMDTEQNHRQLTAAREMLHTVSERLHAGDVTNVGFLEFPMQRGDTGYGCDWHPSAATHAAMGAQLAASLAATLDWHAGPAMPEPTP